VGQTALKLSWKYLNKYSRKWRMGLANAHHVSVVSDLGLEI